MVEQTSSVAEPGAKPRPPLKSSAQHSSHPPPDVTSGTSTRWVAAQQDASWRVEAATLLMHLARSARRTSGRGHRQVTPDLGSPTSPSTQGTPEAPQGWTMRIAMLSDIHGNAVALEAVLTSARAAGIDQYWITGDPVANGPQPVRCAELVRALPGLVAVRGNTDRYVITGELSDMIPELTRPTTRDQVSLLMQVSRAHAWTKGALAATGHHEWLASLPVEQRRSLPDGTACLLVHASPGRDDGPGVRPDITGQEWAQQGWNHCGADLAFVGHTHQVSDHRADQSSEPGTVRVVNSGSVGQPQQPATASWTLLEADRDGYHVSPQTTPWQPEELREVLDLADHPGPGWLATKLGLTQTI